MDSADSRRDEEAPLVAAEASPAPSLRRSHARDVHILSCGFLLIFLAYGAAQNLESTVNTTDNLGTISLGILYVSFTFFSLVASLVVRAIGPKNAILLGTTGYWLFIAANLKPSWLTMVPASFYLGFAASIIWVGQGTYLTSTARSHAKECSLHEGTVIGAFNGEFWGMFASHQVVGNLVSLAVLREETVCGIIPLLIPSLFYLSVNLLMSPAVFREESDGSASGTTLLFIVFLCSMTFGTILMCFLRKRDSREESALSPEYPACFHSSLVSLSKSVISPLFDVRMVLIIPLIAYSGLQQAFVWAEFTKDIVKPALGESGVAGSMVVYGAFDAICSVAAGRLTSGLTSITWIVSGGALLQASAFVWMLVKSSFSGVFQIICPLVLAAILGIGDGVLNTQLNALLGLLFKRDTEGAFAQLKVWQSASIAVIFFLSPYISLEAMLWIMLAGVCVSFSGFLYLSLRVEKTFYRPSS